MKFRFLAIVLTAVLGVACDEMPVSPSSVTSSTWRLVSLQRGSGAPVIVSDPGRYTLSLEEDGRLVIKSDCNSCNGSYTLTGTALQVRPMACTRAFCGTASLDSIFTEGLQNAQMVTIATDTLVVEGGGFTLRFGR